MKQILFLIISLFLSITSYSQSEINGEIKNIENNEPIPYVNIGVFEKKVGTVSNDKGYFSIKLNETVKKNGHYYIFHYWFRTKENSFIRL